jgi:hypothetical protein
MAISNSQNRPPLPDTSLIDLEELNYLEKMFKMLGRLITSLESSPILSRISELSSGTKTMSS